MRSQIAVDDGLMAEAMSAAGLPSKEDVIEEALRLLVQRHQRLRALANMEGQGWDGDLDAMREGRADSGQ